MSTTVVDVILPCLDEEQALPWILGRLPEGYRAIVVDNGSTDRSAEVARGLGATVVSESRRGFGAAAHAGLLAATADIVAFCDADASMDPQDLPLLVAPVAAGEVELTLGRRRPTVRGAWPIHARIANLVLARLMRRASGVRLHDLGPMRAARRADLLALDLQDRRSGYPLEMVLRGSESGFRIRELDTPYTPRIGKSKVTGTLRGTIRAIQDMSALLRAASPTGRDTSTVPTVPGSPDSSASDEAVTR
ncbi:glycosyltransferase family 2 protein [Frondihabitans peucedani]|uniref:Glycosyltransferase family 2 protein n=1 Tax=Frondihabitans peucedani TaxID=598626 RepID=A0ABP8E5Z1_9MICO